MITKMGQKIGSAALMALISSSAFANVIGGDGGDPQNAFKKLNRTSVSSGAFEAPKGGDGSDPRNGPSKGGDGSDPRNR
jgi:hypothetical protein